MLPDRPALKRLVGLVRAFVGYEVGFAINPVLARTPSRRWRWPGGRRPARLEQLGPGARRRAAAADAADAVFEAELVEGFAA